MMRITLDIDAEDLKKIQGATGIKKKSPAINSALQTYLRDTRKRQFLRRVMEGRTDYSTSNEDLEKEGLYDPH